MLNFTSCGEEEDIKLSMCSWSVKTESKQSEGIKLIFSPYFFVPVNVFLSYISLTGNILILIALQKASSLHSSSKLLFRCLSCTDLFVGLLSQPIFVTYLMAIVNQNWNLCAISENLAFISSALLCGVSISTLTAISVDRLLSLLLRLRYRQIVTFTRVRLFVITSWFTNFAFAMSYLWRKRIFFLGSCVWLLLCLSISSCCYLKIYVCLRRQKAQVHVSQVYPGASLNIARYKKTVSSALWIHLTLIACYLPYTIAIALSTVHGFTPQNVIAWSISGILVFLNSSLNPILYCWKINEVRRATKETIAQWFG